MSWIDKGSKLFRRMSALYLFFIVLVGFFVLFYYKYVPYNKEELNERGYRVLTQLIDNFNKKDQELDGIFGSVRCMNDYKDLVAKKAAFEQLNGNVPYDIQPGLADTGNGKKALSHLDQKDNGDCLILYRNKLKPVPPFTALVKVQDFADPLFTARTDIFENYFLLLDTTDGTANKKHALKIIYRQQGFVNSSSVINVDTLQQLEKNSDQSGVCQLHIGGKDYEVFIAPFDFYRQHILLAGLIPKAVYDQKIQATPINFLPLSIILIVLILIALPSAKVFFLSPKESIRSRDVLVTAFSFYGGSAAITIIVFYSFLIYVSDISLHRRLEHFSKEICKDIGQEIDLADRQLKCYDDRAAGISLVADQLATRDRDSQGGLLDSVCSPTIYPNISRLLWADADGRTIAKWNPFDFVVPFTKVNGYTAFRLLKEQPAYITGVAGRDHPVVYPGKSNLTAEFQTEINRLSNRHFKVPGDSCGMNLSGSRSQAYCIVVAAFLHCSLQPVIPKGFGFCLVDHDGKVLIDADARRNLSENIIAESGDNTNLQDILLHKTSHTIFDLQLYGRPCKGKCEPIANQPLYLVTYYDRKIFTRNIFRFLHFSLETLLCIWIAIAVCLLLSTFKEWKLVRLFFKFNKTEWIRPSATTYRSREFTFFYFMFLAILSAIVFVLITVFSVHLNSLFYLSLLLPFYTVLGAVLSRGTAYTGKQTGTQKEKVWAHFKAGAYPLAAIVVLNIIIYLLMSHTGLTDEGYIVTGFQLLLLLFLAVCCIRNPLKWHWRGKILPEKWVGKKERYMHSLYLSILLIGILPTLGILTYAFYAEKIQYKKDKLFCMGGGFSQRSNYLLTDLFPPYKPKVRDLLGGSAYYDNLIFHQSIYLTDKDSIRMTDSLPPANSSGKKASLPDGLYSLLMDDVYHADEIWEDGVSIQDQAGDESWTYEMNRDKVAPLPRIRYWSRQPVYSNDSVNNLPATRYVVMEANLQRPLADLFHLPVIMLFFLAVLIGVLLIVARLLIDSVIKRLFLVEILDKNRIETDNSYLQKFLWPGYPKETYLKGFNFPNPLTVGFFGHERSFDEWEEKPDCTQEEYILAMTDAFGKIYDWIWFDLSPEEQYALLDFAGDRYANYKNSGILFQLMRKGLLVPTKGVLDLFSLSFRQHILSKRDTPEVAKLKDRYSAPGNWENIRIPVLSIIAVMAIFILKTEAAFTNSLIAMLGAATTILPLVLKIFAKDRVSD